VTAITSAAMPLVPSSKHRGGIMSATLVELVVESPKKAIGRPELVLAVEAASPKVVAEPVREGDPHPLVPVFIMGGIALIGAFAFVGSIVIWLLLRHSGVIAP
jgi:hypothetical protein